MPKEMIPLNTDPYENVDDTELRDVTAAILKNAYVDELKNTKIRPGLDSKWDLSTDVTNATYYTSVPLDGQFWWNTRKRLIIAAGRSLYVIDSPHAAPIWIGSPTNLTQGTPVVFADCNDYLVGCNGAGLFYVKVTGGVLTAANVADADAPKFGTHVAFLDGYTLGNNNDGTFQWSAADDPTDWDALDFATAEAGPDKVMSMLVNWREILLVGENTTETWYNAGTTAPFGKLAGVHIESGTSARYTVKEFGDTWGWFDQDKRLVRLSQRAPQVVSGPFEKAMEAIAKVDDATGDVLDVGGRNWYILTFPSANRTFAYEYEKSTWSEWSTWDADAALDIEWRARHFCHVPDWNMHLAGDRTSSKIFDVSPDYHDDDGDNIRVMRRTGHITHNTHVNKRSNNLVIRCKRGVGSVAGTEPTMSVRWRSNNGPWNTPREVSLGKIGDDYSFATLRGLGMYRSRQYEFVLLGASDFVLMDAEEDFDLLR